MNKLIMVAALLAVVACAKQPENIAAVSVGTGAYNGLSCSSLRKEQLKEKQKLTNLSAKQKSAANSDAVGVFLLGLPISSMSGNDVEAEIAVTKGKIQAIDQRKAARGCS